MLSWWPPLLPPVTHAVHLLSFVLLLCTALTPPSLLSRKMSFQSLELSPNSGRNETLWPYLWDVHELHYFILAKMCNENHSNCTCPVHDFTYLCIYWKQFLSKQALCHGRPYVNFLLLLGDSTQLIHLNTHTKYSYIALSWNSFLRVKRTLSIWTNSTIKDSNLLTYMWPKTTSQCTFHHTVSLQDLLQDSLQDSNLQFLGFTTG